MTSFGLPIEPADADLEAFWTHAIIAGKLNPIDAVGGQTDLVSLRPGAFAFGATRVAANRLAELVLTGAKRATSSYAAAYALEGESFPTPDDMWILCDGEGRPRALLRNTDVVVTPFDEIGPDVADAEGEGDLATWRADHERFFTEEGNEFGYDFDPSGDVVTEYFEVLYAK
ncbi:ASCH domain-containing protein [Trueperella pecoris]|uniref:ASCH domain-containing protein n=1 Tax=Trueperella pecoris TaxID=2733571 RepID=UPI00186B72EC|nr:ASCH domain-containing protein [Trueperella pecoris]QOQ38052.1 ASCH domain-containing protein [Trueperella pecoris]QTG75342.1 ASCH domain-containing protein [Trueperella pecoris]